MDNDIDKLIIELIQKKCITYDNINLKYDFKNIISYPYLINIIIKFFYEKTKFFDYNNIIGINNVSSHLASIISYNYNIPLLMLSKTTLKNIQGLFLDDCNCIIITDIIDSGKNILNYINLLKKNNIIVKNILTICDINSNNKKDELLNYNIHSLFQYDYISDILVKNNVMTVHNKIKLTNNNKYNLSYRLSITTNDFVKKLMNIMISKKTNICFNCNINSIKDIIKLVDSIGNYICILEINSDNITNFCNEYAIALKKIADNYNFIIFDNLNICSTSKKIYFELNSLDVINSITIIDQFKSNKFILNIDSSSSNFKQFYNIIKSNKNNIIGALSSNNNNNNNIYDNSILCLNNSEILLEKDINSILMDNNDIYRISASLILQNPGDFIKAYKKKLWIFKD